MTATPVVQTRGIIGDSKKAYDIFMLFFEPELFSQYEETFVMYLNEHRQMVGIQKHVAPCSLVLITQISAVALAVQAKGIIVAQNVPRSAPQAKQHQLWNALGTIHTSLKMAYYDYLLLSGWEQYYSFVEGE